MLKKMNLNAKPYEPPVQPSKSPVNVNYKKNTFIPIIEREVDLNQLYIFLTNNSLWHSNNANYIKSFNEYIRTQDQCFQDKYRKYYELIDHYQHCVRINLFFVDAIIDYMKKQIAKKNILNNPEQNSSGLLFSEIEDIINLVNMKKLQTQNIMIKVNEILKITRY